MFYNSKTKKAIQYILKHEKIIKHFKYLDPRTKTRVPWLEISVKREPVRVLGRNVRANHLYDVPKKNYKKPNKYFDPLYNLDFNTKNDFKAYRAKLGLMNTDLIIRKRKQYHLTQKQTAQILGINPIHYRSIEHGSLRFEKEWYSKLYVLMNNQKMNKLIKNYKNK